MGTKFSWVAAYKEIALKLCDYEDNQKELINILEAIGITRFTDYDIDGSPFELEEIDPFTFFSYMNKFNDDNRIEYLQRLYNRLSLTSEYPTDVIGLPTSHPMKVWLFGYKRDRQDDDIPTLWKLFRQTLNRNIDNDTLQKALRIRCVGKGKLTICWFYSDPEYYLPLDSQTSKYLRDNGLKYVFSTVEEYINIRNTAHAKFDKAPFKISADAWDSQSKAKTKIKNTQNKVVPDTDNGFQHIGRRTFLEKWHEKPEGIIENVSDLMRFVFDKSEMADNDSCFYYRGHSSTTYELKPGIYRKPVSLITHEHIMFKELESAVPSEFSSCKCTFDRLVKMQHYELPSRLLDITANPLVALYFACAEKEKLDHDGKIYLFQKYDDSILSKYSDSDAVSVVANIARRSIKFEIDSIRTLDRETFNEQDEIDFLLHEIRCCEKPHFRSLIDPKDIESIFFVKPKMDNPRIIKQEGAFFIFGISGTKAMCPDMLEFFDYNEYVIPADSKKIILNQLDAMGINEASLFPEIDHVARVIKKKYS